MSNANQGNRRARSQSRPRFQNGGGNGNRRLENDVNKLARSVQQLAGLSGGRRRGRRNTYYNSNMPMQPMQQPQPQAAKKKQKKKKEANPTGNPKAKARTLKLQHVDGNLTILIKFPYTDKPTALEAQMVEMCKSFNLYPVGDGSTNVLSLLGEAGEKYSPEMLVPETKKPSILVKPASHSGPPNIPAFSGSMSAN